MVCAPLTVVCWKWGDKFSCDHVNKLRSMVSRNLHAPHEFVCVCDDARGIDPSVRIVPLWDDLRDMGGCYTRLKIFGPGMRDIFGPRLLSLDLDMVIVGDITPLIERPEQFVIWQDPNPPTPYCGSMWMLETESRTKVWTDFNREQSPVMARRYIGTDQAWLGHRLPDEAVWTPSDGVISFTKNLKEGALPLPVHAKVVVFHGRYDPSHESLQSQCPWIGEHWQ